MVPTFHYPLFLDLTLMSSGFIMLWARLKIKPECTNEIIRNMLEVLICKIIRLEAVLLNGTKFAMITVIIIYNIIYL